MQAYPLRVLEGGRRSYLTIQKFDSKIKYWPHSPSSKSTTEDLNCWMKRISIGKWEHSNKMTCTPVETKEAGRQYRTLRFHSQIKSCHFSPPSKRTTEHLRCWMERIDVNEWEIINRMASIPVETKGAMNKGNISRFENSTAKSRISATHHHQN